MKNEKGKRDDSFFVLWPSVFFLLPFTFYLLSLIFCSAITAWACPMCKEALADPTQVMQRLATAKAYALSIGVLLTVPAALIGGVAALVIRASKHRAPPAQHPS